MKSPVQDWLLRGLAWSWLGVILLSQTAWAGEAANWLASLVLGSGPEGFGWSRLLAQKGYHVFIFATFALLLTLPRGYRDWRTCLALCVGIGVVAEALQTLAVGRNPTPYDAALNVLAGLLTLFVCWRLGWFNPQPTRTAGAS